MRAPLIRVLAASSIALACRAPQDRHRPETGPPPGAALVDQHPALRRLLVADAEAVPAAFARLEQAAQTRDARAARAASLELRRAFRRLLPVVTLLTHSSTLEPLDDDPEEIPPELGLGALSRALAHEPPDWDALARSLTTTRPAALLVPGEARTASLAAPKLADALSRGIFRWGVLLDGSAAESPEEERVDALEGGRALVRYARELLPDARDARPLETAVTELERWLDAHAPEPVKDRLEALVLSAELGAAVRSAFAARGVNVLPPFAPRRPRGAQLHAEPVSVATFPRLPGAEPDARRAALGRALFHDVRLSAKGSLSCASCHRERDGLSAGRTRPRRFDGGKLARDVPGLFNVAYEPMFFWDGRASTLARQVEIAVENDLGASWPSLLDRLASDEALAARFRAAYPDGLTRDSVTHALAEHERTLIADDTPFDRWVRGDRSALGPAELAGFDVYYGSARCSRCHRLPLTTGAEPPRFTSAEVSALGVPTRPGARTRDPDRGRGAITGRPEHEHAFKVPSLRGLSRTAPYFHNGAFATLEEVVDFYARGAGQGLGIAPRSFDPDARAFELSAEERRALLAFLRRGLDRAR